MESITDLAQEVAIKCTTNKVPLEKEIELSLPNDYQFKDENGNIINATKIVLGKKEENGCCNLGLKFDKLTIADNICTDKVEIALQDYELKQEGDKWFAIKKKKEYPTTYGECCKVLCCKPIVGFAGLDNEEENLYGKFIALKRCRDAYWKIAGDWKPDLENGELYFMYYGTCGNIILKDHVTNGIYCNVILAFPSEEMRDAFYENFKELIGSVKELL